MFLGTHPVHLPTGKRNPNFLIFQKDFPAQGSGNLVILPYVQGKVLCNWWWDSWNRYRFSSESKISGTINCCT